MTPDPDAATLPEPDAPPDVSSGTLPGEDFRPVEISVLDSKIINAFALPGRHIVITSAMLEETKTPEELAGVLAHEMGHITERHSLKRVVRAYGLELIFQLVAGQGDLFNAVGGLGYTLAESRFSRADETMADRLGVERMLAAGLSPASLADLFERIQVREGGQADAGGTYLNWEYLSSHPSLDKRIAEMRSLARAAEAEADVPLGITPLLSGEDWKNLRNICIEQLKEI
jgi:predicted Zn-dependent protease